MSDPKALSNIHSITLRESIGLVPRVVKRQITILRFNEERTYHIAGPSVEEILSFANSLRIPLSLTFNSSGSGGFNTSAILKTSRHHKLLDSPTS